MLAAHRPSGIDVVVAEAMAEGVDVGVGEAVGFDTAGDPHVQSWMTASKNGRFIG